MKNWKGMLASIGAACASMLLANAATVGKFIVCVSNERQGTVSVIDGSTLDVTNAIEVGQRPRGIHASPDGTLLFVAVSGTPIAGPPKKDAKGKVIDDDDEREADHTKDGIAVVDLCSQRVLKKMPAGTDPEQFAVSHDGHRLYIANEDVGTLSVLSIAAARVEHTIPVQDEPEGVALSPDGKLCYVTCEAGGQVIVIDTMRNRAVAEFKVGARPRSAAFLPDGSSAFVPAESVGELNVVDVRTSKVLATIRLPDGSLPMDTAISRDGKRLFVSTGRGGTVCVFDTSSLSLLHTIKVGTRPWGIGLSPDGKLLFVANGPSNDVSVVDTSGAREIKRIKAGMSPWGVAVVTMAAPGQTAAK